MALTYPGSFPTDFRPPVEAAQASAEIVLLRKIAYLAEDDDSYHDSRDAAARSYVIAGLFRNSCGNEHLPHRGTGRGRRGGSRWTGENAPDSESPRPVS